MSTSTCQTQVGVFSSREAAEAAISELHRSGFTENEIGLIHRNTQDATKVRDRNSTSVDGDDDAEDATGGAVAGAVTGLGIGALVGAGVLAGIVPVVGPALFAGTLGVLASNAAGGAAVAGIVGALTGWGLSNEDATYYESEVSAGRSIVTVTSDRCDEAQQIMMRHGGTSRAKTAVR
jgi:hypothetical protein